MQLLKPSWVNHDEGQAIFSVDIHPDGSRFATGGQGQGQDASGRVVIWNMKPVLSEKHEQDPNCPKLLCQLDQHLGCVNCVRWSMSGRYLASAGDDKVIIIWQLSNYGGGSVFGSNVVNVEWWRCVSTLRGHDGDILDVSWAPHDAYLASVSVDNTVIIWNPAKWPERVRVLRGHHGLVKGVAWDPVGRYVASQGDDRSLLVWRTADWGQETAVIKPFQECGGTTSVLRPSWSPDGQYLVSAHAMNNGGPTAQIIDRDQWTTDKDFVGHRKPITCVRFNPNILKKETKNGKAVQYCCVAIGSRDRSVSIWFTSLKRPLVVIHDVFEDSVLDLSFSACGRWLLAVSKDGSLAAITFSEEEMGRALSKEETDSVYLKLYGQCSSSNNIQAAAATIIDNPELLKARELAKKEMMQRQQQQQQLNLSGASDSLSRSGSMQRGPDKQIERRTADGRRRITPVFIPPSADGGSMKTFESFSTSRQEKSRIVIEKLDGIVEPNVTTPNKSRPSSTTCTPSKSIGAPPTTTPSPDHGQSGTEAMDKTSTTMRPPPELDGVNPGLTARLERVGKNQEKSAEVSSSGSIGTSSTAVSVKRKLDEPQPIAVKRKRGRPPLDRSQTTANHPAPATPAPPTPASPPPATAPLVVPPVVAPSHTTALVTPGSLAVPAASVAVSYVSAVLPQAVLGKSYRLQVSSVGSDGREASFNVLVENNWREVGGSGAVGRSLHRLTRRSSGPVQWTAYTTAPVTAAAAGSSFLAVTCADASLQLLCLDTGSPLLPRVQLHGTCAHLCVRDRWLLVLTTSAHITLWDVVARKRVLAECVRHLVDGRTGPESIKSIQLVEVKSLNSYEIATDNSLKQSKTTGALQKRSLLTSKKSVCNGFSNNSHGNSNGIIGDMETDPVPKSNGITDGDRLHSQGNNNITGNTTKSAKPHNPAAASEVADQSTKQLTEQAMVHDLPVGQTCSPYVVYSPVLVLGSGEVFGRCSELESWLQLGECAAVRRVVLPQYSRLPPPAGRHGGGEDPPLAGLLRHTAAYMGTSRDAGAGCNSELRSALTESFLKKMLTSSAYLGSRHDYTFWYTRLVHFCISEGREAELRGIFDELLSPAAVIAEAAAGPVSTVMPAHHHLLGSNRRGLLKGFLSELLLADSAGRLQRLYTEYRDLMDSTEQTNHIMI